MSDDKSSTMTTITEDETWQVDRANASGLTPHYAAIAGSLSAKPVIIGHSFGGLLAQILAGRGLAEACVAIDPAPFRGVLPLPISALRVP